MSLLIGGISKDGIAMCGDTRTSIELFGGNYKCDDNFRKVYKIDNETIVFLAGKTDINSETIKAFKNSEKKDIETLIEIAKSCINSFLEKGGKRPDNKRFIQIVLGKYENEKFNIYLAETSHDYKIQKVEGDEFIVPFTGGCHELEAMDIWYKREKQIKTENKTASFDSVALSIYNELSDECVGGFMTFVFLSKNGVSEKIYKIQDNKPVKHIEVHTAHNCYVGANLTVGASNERPVLHLHGMNQDICTISSVGDGDKSTTIDTAGHLILKSVLGTYLQSVEEGNKIATERDIASLEDRIAALERKLANK